LACWQALHGEIVKQRGNPWLRDRLVALIRVADGMCWRSRGGAVKLDPCFHLPPSPSLRRQRALRRIMSSNISI